VSVLKVINIKASNKKLHNKSAFKAKIQVQIFPLGYFIFFGFSFFYSFFLVHKVHLLNIKFFFGDFFYFFFTILASPYRCFGFFFNFFYFFLGTKTAISGLASIFILP